MKKPLGNQGWRPAAVAVSPAPFGSSGAARCCWSPQAAPGGGGTVRKRRPRTPRTTHSCCVPAPPRPAPARSLARLARQVMEEQLAQRVAGAHGARLAGVAADGVYEQSARIGALRHGTGLAARARRADGSVEEKPQPIACVLRRGVVGIASSSCAGLLPCCCDCAAAAAAVGRRRRILHPCRRAHRNSQRPAPAPQGHRQPLHTPPGLPAARPAGRSPMISTGLDNYSCAP